MISTRFKVSLIKGDGIGIAVAESAQQIVDAALKKSSSLTVNWQDVQAGARYFSETGLDIEPGAEQEMMKSDAIFLGAIGLPAVRQSDGTEISPHLRLREIYELYAGVRPVKAYANAPQRLSDPRAMNIDMVILRESTEGLFYSAAVHNRSDIRGDSEVRETLLVSRRITEKLHDFGFRLAEKRKARGGRGKITCVDKANVFAAMAFFRKIFDERSTAFPNIEKHYNYVDAQALDLIRKPWEFDVLVTENMFGDILSDLAAGLVGGMGIAACAEIGDEHGLFQPAHGSAPDIMEKDLANPLAAILSGALMLDYLADKSGDESVADAAMLIDQAVDAGFQQNRLRPSEFGGDMGTMAVTREMLSLIDEVG